MATKFLRIAAVTIMMASASGTAALASMVGDSGTFSGRSNHVTTGSVTLIEDGGAIYVELGEDFSLDGAPDPIVALGNDGYNENLRLGALANLNGKQRYLVPGFINLDEVNEVWIWCGVASVALGVASLN